MKYSTRKRMSQLRGPFRGMVIGFLMVIPLWTIIICIVRHFK